MQTQEMCWDAYPEVHLWHHFYTNTFWLSYRRPLPQSCSRQNIMLHNLPYWKLVRCEHLERNVAELIIIIVCPYCLLPCWHPLGNNHTSATDSLDREVRDKKLKSHCTWSNRTPAFLLCLSPPILLNLLLKRQSFRERWSSRSSLCYERMGGWRGTDCSCWWWWRMFSI